MTSFAEKVIAFNKALRLDIPLPDDIRVMNPFRENPDASVVSAAFYTKYYNDRKKRRLILGINPGRFGAGVTGIPFTDTKRLIEHCGLSIEGFSTHEPSSVFIYEMIKRYGGPEKFFGDYYINSPSPLGFVLKKQNGKEVNYNYYDSKNLLNAIEPFMIDMIRKHISMGIHTDKAFCLGSGKNYLILKRLNDTHHFFDTLIPLEHPRYIMQYRSKDTETYIRKYLHALLKPVAQQKLQPKTYCEFTRELSKDDVNRMHHDHVHGFAVTDDNELFGRMIMEINQAGLSWTTILKKQDQLRRAYDNYCVKKVAAYGEQDRQRLLSDAGIIRNRLKIDAAIHNAGVILQLQQKHGSFKNWLDGQHPKPLEEWIRIFKQTFRFTGKEIVNEFLMSTGYLPGAHSQDCPVYQSVVQSGPMWYQTAANTKSSPA